MITINAACSETMFTWCSETISAVIFRFRNCYYPVYLISLKDHLGSLTTQLKTTETERDIAIEQVKLLEKDKRIEEFY